MRVKGMSASFFFFFFFLKKSTLKFEIEADENNQGIMKTSLFKYKKKVHLQKLKIFR